jgi:SAM-dependent methyltransferase
MTWLPQKTREENNMVARISESKPHLGGNVIGGDRNTFYVELWAWLVKRYNINSVFDVGCGEGHAMREFEALGCISSGIDGLQENVDVCGSLAIVHDLTDSPFILPQPVDLIWCCELVEHVDEQYVGNVIKTLAQGTYVAMTHAVPTQDGYHHVNCKDDQYWISALCSAGYEYLESDTQESRKLARQITRLDYGYWIRSRLIFKRIT